MINEVTFVLTACGRIDLLEQTLDSFFEYNTYPIKRFIITEDSADAKVFEECKLLNKRKYNNQLEWIFNHEKLGQAKSIDTAYKRVDTPYVFHCEEDWKFYRHGFIEDSIRVLSATPKILQAWIRPKNDRILNPISDKIININGINCRVVMPVSFKTGDKNPDGSEMVVLNYMGFSWNPGLKRMSDYYALGGGGYSQFIREHEVDRWYRDNKYAIVSISETNDFGYVKHIGWNRRAGDPGFIKK